MAIAATPTNFIVQTANTTNAISWNGVAGALSYNIERSIDGANYTLLVNQATPTYLDRAVVSGTQYWYQVASVNLSGTSPYTVPQSVIPAPVAELSLASLRLAVQQKADRVNSNFVTVPELNYFIGLAMYELYDLLITSDPDLFMGPRARFATNGSLFSYPMPNGLLTFQDINNNNFVPAPFYRLMGVNLALNTASNAFVTVAKYNFVDRNNYIYPNAGSVIYGVYNMQYRLIGMNTGGFNMEFVPSPAPGQIVQILYIPRLPQLLQDTDISTLGFSGWLQYAIVRAAKYILDKEESDTTKLDQEIAFLKERIENTAANRDEGRPDTISDVRRGGNWGGNGPFNGFQGGW